MMYIFIYGRHLIIKRRKSYGICLALTLKQDRLHYII